MQFLDITFDDPASNLSLDEALLETAEMADDHPEVLRIWESPVPMVVCGRSSPVETEVNLSFCREHGIGVYRRCSGGATVVAGPGCLMYAVLLDFRMRPELKMLEAAHRFVMDQTRMALQRLGIETQMQGTSDLTLGDRKISGNSMRSKRNWMIYHGTLLYDFDLSLITNCLGTPVRQPDYRDGREHDQFLTQLDTNASSLRRALQAQWGATNSMSDWPIEKTDELLKKYRSEEWTFKH